LDKVRRPVDGSQDYLSQHVEGAASSLALPSPFQQTEYRLIRYAGEREVSDSIALWIVPIVCFNQKT